MARAHQNLIWTRNPHTNALRLGAARVLPGRVRGVRSTCTTATPSNLRRAPSPLQAASPSLSKIRSALKAAGRQRNLDFRAQEIQTVLRTANSPPPPPRSAAAFGPSTRATVGIIAELNRQIIDLEAELATHFETHPDADIYRSLPGLGVILGARVLGHVGDDPNRYTDSQVSQKLRRNITADGRVGQETRRAGPPRPQSPALRRGRPMGLLRPELPAPAPAPSTINAALPGTCTTKHSEPSATALSASSTAAYATTRSTTNKRPGHTAKTTPPTRPLDNLRPWDV